MVPLPLIRSTNTAVAQAQPLIAVFVGATTGIGEFSVRALAKAHGVQGKGLRIYIIGRNAAAAEKIFKECREVCPNGQFVFVRGGDISLLKNVDAASVEILRLENEREKEESGKEGGMGKARIDFLVMCQGVVYFDGRKGKSPQYFVLICIDHVLTEQQKRQKDSTPSCHCGITRVSASRFSSFLSSSPPFSRLAHVSSQFLDQEMRKQAEKTKSTLMTSLCATQSTTASSHSGIRSRT